ncbi:MAG: nucleotide excision repair endonuclease [Planococcaceae bacterium]|jgi:excinuclease UvrABC nuclease subunit|uniref:nucleotide excision repair endonuclease n=1 Tax=Paenisporosarcina quisquiliarum TaxID=365346 RepID=UPI00242310DF|nr:nucleotide excision repair endonuclease [Bacillota bacterium]MDX1771200.1 nucleotide excision repair endonuclease [Planococcaceae bacterium]
MIKIELPKPDLVIRQRTQVVKENEVEIPSVYGFIDFHQIPRDKGGLIMFFNRENELLFVGKARKLRQRVKKHFEDNVSPIKNHREEVVKIEIFFVDDALDREIYETYAINKLVAKYNVDKKFVHQ